MITTERQSYTFSPLFIGAMVATPTLRTFADSILCFQSPFHRGNGCYNAPEDEMWGLHTFQSAFHRGNGCYQFDGTIGDSIDIMTFSPLFIAAMVATIPKTADPSTIPNFQSAFHRGNGCYLACPSATPQAIRAFSPLFIAAMVATTTSVWCAQ